MNEDMIAMGGMCLSNGKVRSAVGKKRRTLCARHVGRLAVRECVTKSRLVCVFGGRRVL